MSKNRKINVLLLDFGHEKCCHEVKNALEGTEIPIKFSIINPGDDYSELKYHLVILYIAAESIKEALKFIEDEANISKKIIVILPENETLQNVVMFLDHVNVDQILLRKENWKRLLKTVINVLSIGNIFGMEKYLPEGESVSYLRFKDFEGRKFVLNKVDEVAKSVGIRRMRRQHCVQAAEELVMNALYNAPRDESGTMTFGSIDPHKRVSMDSPKPVSLRYSTTSEGFFMAVRDRFGALNKNTVLTYLKKCIYSKQQIDRKTIGAGLGIYLTVNRVQTYIVNVAPEVATEVIVSIKQTKQFGVPEIIAFFEY